MITQTTKLYEFPFKNFPLINGMLFAAFWLFIGTLIGKALVWLNQ